MVIKSRQEIDFKRLLRKCELMASQRHENTNDWRLKEFVHSLEDRLNELQTLNVFDLDQNEFTIYSKKVAFLKGVIEADCLSSPSHRLIATEILSPISNSQTKSIHIDKTKEIHLNTLTKYENDVRGELFDSNVRKRDNKQNGVISDDFDAIIKYHHSMQERVADEMLELARSLKQNCTLSNQIIKKDTEILESTSQFAENNYDNLLQNTNKIENFVRRSCHYWLWIMLAIVSFTFLWIVMFIKMFPKKHYS